MGIVISSKVRLVITDADVTDFDSASEATEISILKDIRINRGMNSIAVGAGGVTSTPDRVPTVINSGYTETKLTFSTYLKPVNDGGNVSSAERLLWESLSATDTVDNGVNSTISFGSGNVNKLRELYFYLIFDDGTYYKVKQGIVASVSLDLDINNISKATWEIFALGLEYVEPADLLGTPLLMTDEQFIRNKLSTVLLNVDSVDYDLAVIKASFKITNTVVPIGRKRVGQLTNVTGHYVSTRTSELQLQFYLNDKADGSSALTTALLAYTNITDINTTTAVTLSIGGASKVKRIDLDIPQGKIKLNNPTVGLYNTVDITVYPQESVPGLGDEVTLIYEN